MVGSMGLGGSLISFRALDQGAFGGNMAAKVLADQEARAAVAKLLEDNKGVVEKVLSSHRHLIEALRDALIERHELMDNEILDVIVGAEGRPNVVIDLRDEALVG
jgi:ATP-dependent Zn protease